MASNLLLLGYMIDLNITPPNMIEWYQNGTIINKEEILMVNLTLKNLNENLHKKLIKQAKKHNRSLNKEILTCLENAVQNKPISTEKLLAQVKEIRNKLKGSITVEEINNAKSAKRP